MLEERNRLEAKTWHLSLVLIGMWLFPHLLIQFKQYQTHFLPRKIISKWSVGLALNEKVGVVHI